MACTTILVGKNASYDGSTMIARNDDSGSGHFTYWSFADALEIFLVFSAMPLFMDSDQVPFSAACVHCSSF
jgi:hypothetical protein